MLRQKYPPQTQRSVELIRRTPAIAIHQRRYLTAVFKISQPRFSKWATWNNRN